MGLLVHGEVGEPQQVGGCDRWWGHPATSILGRAFPSQTEPEVRVIAAKSVS